MVDLSVVMAAVVPPVVPVAIVAVVVALDVLEGSNDVAAIVDVGAGVVLFDRVTYEKGVEVGGRDTPSKYG